MPPATEEKLNTTLREVIGESIIQPQKKSEEKSSEQTQTGRKPEYISGIDVSDLPDSISREELKGLLTKKAKLLEDGYQSKFKGVAELAKVQDELKTLGVSTQEARKMINDAIANKNNTSLKDVTKEVKREIDALKEEAADPETRKGVERLERVIKELAPDSPAFKEIRKELDEIKKALGYVQNKTIQSRIESLTENLDSLSGEKFDRDFIEKYREKVIENGKLYPDASVHKILQVIADPQEYDDALLKTKKKEEIQKRNITEKLNATETSSSGVTGSEKIFDIQKNSLKNTLRHVFTKKK